MSSLSFTVSYIVSRMLARIFLYNKIGSLWMDGWMDVCGTASLEAGVSAASPGRNGFQPNRFLQMI